MTYTPEEISEMLRKHALWLARANLRRADLREASLRGADLSEANLRGANLREALTDIKDLSQFITHHSVGARIKDIASKAINPTSSGDE